jgi:hypothetical protein
MTFAKGLTMTNNVASQDESIDRDKVLNMAKQAQVHEELCGEHFIYEFAKLVASAAIAKEREAFVTEAAKQGWAMKNEDSFEDAVRDIAVIRARGQT